MKQNGVVCQPGLVLLFFIFRFEYLISGPKSYLDFREMGPSIVHVSVQQKSLFLCQTLAAKLACQVLYSLSFTCSIFGVRQKEARRVSMQLVLYNLQFFLPNWLVKERKNMTLWSQVPNSVHAFKLSQIHSSSPTYNITLFLAQSQHLLVGVYIAL